MTFASDVDQFAIYPFDSDDGLNGECFGVHVHVAADVKSCGYQYVEDAHANDVVEYLKRVQYENLDGYAE